MKFVPLMITLTLLATGCAEDAAERAPEAAAGQGRLEVWLGWGG